MINLNTNIAYITLALLLCTAAFFLGRFSVSPEKVIEYKTVKTTDTVDKYQVNTIERFYPKFYTIHDTVLNEFSRIDTIYLDTNQSPSRGLYVAQMDTVGKDSSYTLSVKFNSPIQLDTRSFFSYNLGIRERIIKETETVYIERAKGFFDYVKFSIYSGIGYGITTKKFDFNVGMGITITPFN